MFGWIFLAAFLLLVVWLFTAPLRIEADSVQGRARVRFHFIVLFSVAFRDSAPPEVRFFGVRWRARRSSDAESAKRKKAGRRVAGSRGGSWRKLLAVARSFRVEELVLHLDTGDQPLNGMLYPLAVLLSSRTKHDIRISFTGESRLILRLRNNLLRMLRAYVRG